MCLASCFKMHLVQMYTALGIGANSCNELNKPPEERSGFQTIQYSAAPTVTITSRLLKHVISMPLWTVYSVSKSSEKRGGEKSRTLINFDDAFLHLAIRNHKF